MVQHLLHFSWVHHGKFCGGMKETCCQNSNEICGKFCFSLHTYSLLLNPYCHKECYSIYHCHTTDTLVIKEIAVTTNDINKLPNHLPGENTGSISFRKSSGFFGRLHNTPMLLACLKFGRERIEIFLIANEFCDNLLHVNVCG